jgi:hypothetical protein
MNGNRKAIEVAPRRATEKCLMFDRLSNFRHRGIEAYIEHDDAGDVENQQPTNASTSNVFKHHDRMHNV